MRLRVLKKNMKLFNEIDEIYEKGIVPTSDGQFKCSVCGKIYKTQKNADKHIAKQNCHSYSSVFKGNQIEYKFFSVYNFLAGVEGETGYSFNRFRKSGRYTQIAKLYVFCSRNRLNDIEDYLVYILETYSLPNAYYSLVMGQKESVLVEYRNWLRRNVSNGDSYKFYNEYKEQLEDTSFVLRSLERGDIHYEFLFDKIDFDGFVEILSDIEKDRLESFLRTVV